MTIKIEYWCDSIDEFTETEVKFLVTCYSRGEEVCLVKIFGKRNSCLAPASGSSVSFSGSGRKSLKFRDGRDPYSLTSLTLSRKRSQPPRQF